jgi:hypothetical protein
MSKYGPQAYTQDRSGELLAQALTNAAQSFVGMRRQKQQDRIASDERTRQHGREDINDAITRDQSGYGVGNAPGDDLANALPSGGFVERHPTSGTPFDEHLSFDPSNLGDALRGPAPSSSLTSPVRQQQQQPQPATGHPGAFNPMTGTFGSPPPAPRYRQVTSGVYQDTTRSPEARHLREVQSEHELAQALEEQDRGRAAGDYTAAGVDSGRARLYARNPGLAQNDPTIGRPLPPRDPVMGSTEWKNARRFESELRPDDKTLVQVQTPDGAVIYMPRSQAAGMHAPSKTGVAKDLPAPLAAKVGQAGEMIKKAYDVLPQMDALDVSLENSAAQDVAQHGVGAFGMHIPGTQGAGSLMLNRDPAYSKYQASLSPFILAAAHALSGARINQDQVEQIRHSIEFKPGDTKDVRAQKRKNMVDLVNSISGSLPATAIAEQEDQMDPGSIALLKGTATAGLSAPRPQIMVARRPQQGAR